MGSRTILFFLVRCFIFVFYAGFRWRFCVPFVCATRLGPLALVFCTPSFRTLCPRGGCLHLDDALAWAREKFDFRAPARAPERKLAAPRELG